MYAVFIYWSIIFLMVGGRWTEVVYGSIFWNSIWRLSWIWIKFNKNIESTQIEIEISKTDMTLQLYFWSWQQGNLKGTKTFYWELETCSRCLFCAYFRQKMFWGCNFFQCTFWECYFFEGAIFYGGAIFFLRVKYLISLRLITRTWFSILSYQIKVGNAR